MRRWVELGRAISASRLLIDGSFVTAKAEPGDVDAVMLLPSNFNQLLAYGTTQALELEEMFLSRQPAELFAAEDLADWFGWIEFFSRTREANGCKKGLVEVAL